MKDFCVQELMKFLLFSVAACGVVGFTPLSPPTARFSATSQFRRQFSQWKSSSIALTAEAPKSCVGPQVIFFVNSASGGGRHPVKKLLENTVGADQVADLASPSSVAALLERTKEQLLQCTSSISNESSTDIVRPAEHPTSVNGEPRSSPPTASLPSSFNSTTSSPSLSPTRDEMVAGSVRVVACGGDGTVGWVLRLLQDARLDLPVAVLPLGTGNDLSRMLGWGSGVEELDEEILAEFLAALQRAQVRRLDQWEVRIATNSGRVKRKDQSSGIVGRGGDMKQGGNGPLMSRGKTTAAEAPVLASEKAANDTQAMWRYARTKTAAKAAFSAAAQRTRAAASLMRRKTGSGNATADGDSQQNLTATSSATSAVDTAAAGDVASAARKRRQRRRAALRLMRSKALARLPWLVRPTERGDGVTILLMHNYLGIGIDAQVASTFDAWRHARPDLFVSRLVNKLWYFYFGSANFAQTQLAFALQRVKSAWQSLKSRLEESPLGALTSLLAAPASAGRAIWRAIRRRTVALTETISWKVLGFKNPQLNRGNSSRSGSSSYKNRGESTKVSVYRPWRGQKARSEGLRKRWTLKGRCRAHGGCVDLARKLEVVLDAGRPSERVVALPPRTQGLVLLNIDSFMGGGRMWGVRQKNGNNNNPWAIHSPDEDEDALVEGTTKGAGNEQDIENRVVSGSNREAGQGTEGREAFDGRRGEGASTWSAADGLLEVVCVESSLHLGRILLGMAKPIKLGQAATVDLRSNVTLPLQVLYDQGIEGCFWSPHFHSFPYSRFAFHS